MTNLSDLLPSGGGAKEATAVASGTLSTGQTVSLLSNGQIEATSETTATASLGSEVDFSPDVGGNYDIVGFYYEDQNAVVFVYQDTNSYLAAVAGTISGSTITFGTEVVGFSSASPFPNAAYSTTDNKAVAVWKDNNITGNWLAKQLTVSGTTVTWESTDVTVSTHGNYAIGIEYDPSSDRFFTVWPVNASTGQLYHNIGQISGSTTSWTGVYYNFGGTTYYGYNYTAPPALSYDPVHQCMVVAESAFSGSQPLTAFAVTVPSSGGATVFWNQTTIANGSATTTYTGYNPYLTYDSHNQQHNVAFWDASNGDSNLTTIKITGSNAATVAATVNMSTLLGLNTTNSNGIAYHAKLKKIALLWTDDPGYYLRVVSVDTSDATSSNWTAGTVLEVQSLTYSYHMDPIVYDASSENMAIGSRENPSGDGKGVVYIMDGTTTNVADFIGITSEAIASGVSGKYNPQGGVATTIEPSAGETGTPTAFSGGLRSADMKAVFDSGSNQVVFGFQSPSTGYGTAIVGAINSSNNTVSFGTAGDYQQLSSSYNSITYDASADKIVAVTTDPTASNYYGVAAVGTVAGTGISFTATGSYQNSAVDAQDICYDSTNQTTVVCYGLNNGYGYSKIGTISTGAITFGASTNWETLGNTISYINNTFDSNEGSVVVAYQMSSTGLCVVAGQKSGATMSWGSRVVPHTGHVDVTMSEGGTICFDSQNNKVVVPHKDGTTTFGSVAVCSVSGTTVTAGTPVPFTDVEINGQSVQSTFDSNLNKVIIAYVNQSDSFLKIITGTVSGTSITFDTPIAVTSTAVNTSSVSIAFDSNVNKTMVGYNDNSASAAYGAVYVTTGTENSLTIDATYYIQNNGQITRTATGNTEIGKAVTTTQLLLKGAP